MSRLEDATLAVIQYIDRGDQCLLRVVLLAQFDDDGFRRGRLINEMVLPFAGFIVLMKRCFDGCFPSGMVHRRGSERDLLK